MLDRARMERRADFGDQAFAPLAVVAEHADLDELVALQGNVDFADHRGRETCLAGHHDRLQVVRARSQRTPLRGRQ